MKVNIEKLKGSQVLIRVEVESEKVTAALEDVYSGIQRKAHIRGYRPGKAPRDILESHYNETASEETVNRLVWDCYHEALTDKSIDPAGYPVITDVDFNKAKPLKFSVKVDVRPDVRLRSYKGIKVKEKPGEVTDDDVDKALKQLQESLAEYKNVEPRPVAKGDYLVCSYECFSDGKLVDKNEKLWLYISDQLQPKELLDVLLGAGPGSVKETRVSYPENYEYKELAGKTRLYKVTPKEIKQKLLPAIDDELAKATGRFRNLAELKADLTKNILGRKKLEARRELENQIYGSLLKQHTFEVPDSLVQRQSSQLAEEAKQRLLQQGYKKEDLDKQDDKLKESVKAKASNNVRLFFIIQKIAEQENIKVSESDLKQKIDEIADYTKEDSIKVTERLKDKNLLEKLKEQVLHDKVVDFLLEHAKKI